MSTPPATDDSYLANHPPGDAVIDEWVERFHVKGHPGGLQDTPGRSPTPRKGPSSHEGHV